MPQLDISTFPPQLFWLAVTFIVLYLLMSRLGLPRVTAIIEARRKRLDDDLSRAAEVRAEAEATVAAYQRTLAEARAVLAVARDGKVIPPPIGERPLGEAQVALDALRAGRVIGRVVLAMQ